MKVLCRVEGEDALQRNQRHRFKSPTPIGAQRSLISFSKVGIGVHTNEQGTGSGASLNILSVSLAASGPNSISYSIHPCTGDIHTTDEQNLKCVCMDKQDGIMNIASGSRMGSSPYPFISLDVFFRYNTPEPEATAVAQEEGQPILNSTDWTKRGE